MNEWQFLKFNLHFIQTVENKIYAANVKHDPTENIKINEKSCKLGGDAIIIKISRNKTTVTLEVPFTKN